MQSRYFLIAAFTVITLNTTNVKAMEQALQTQETNEVAAYLKENRNNPNKVIKLIAQSVKKSGSNETTILLTKALTDAQIWIGDIKDSKFGENCLKLLCNKKDRDVLDLDCVKIILYVASDEALNLFACCASDGWSAWHDAIFYGRNDIVDLFIYWANDNKKIKELFAIKNNFDETALHIAAFHGHVSIFKTLLAQADKWGIVGEILNARDKYDKTVLDVDNKNQDTLIRKEIIEEMISITEEYLVKS